MQGGAYGYKDAAESMILSACTESMILSEHAVSIILSAGLLLPPLLLCCCRCCLCLRRHSSGVSTGVAGYRHKGSDVATTVVDFVFVFLFIAPRRYAVVSHLFPAADIGVTALPVTVAVVLGAIVPQVESKMAPTTMTVATMNETCHGALSTPPSDPHLR